MYYAFIFLIQKCIQNYTIFIYRFIIMISNYVPLVPVVVKNAPIEDVLHLWMKLLLPISP